MENESSTYLLPPVTYLNAFNNKLDLLEAYKWNQTQVNEFMTDVITYPTVYGVKSRVVPELKRLRNHVLDLSKNGKTYSAKDLEPSQAIGRKLNPKWTEDSQHVSKFDLEVSIYGGVSYWCSFDLLGRFISLLGPAPEGATISNFYLPLTAMFSRWCVAIAARPPLTISCFWNEHRSHSRFYLGASFTGPYEAGIESPWIKMNKKARFRLLMGDALSATGLTFRSTKAFSKFNMPLHFGDCAETYPLVHMLKRDNSNNDKVHGISLKGVRLFKTRYDHDEACAKMLNACPNCQELIQIWGGEVNNFMKSTVHRNANPRPPTPLVTLKRPRQELDDDPNDKVGDELNEKMDDELNSEKPKKRPKKSNNGLFGWMSTFSRRT